MGEGPNDAGLSRHHLVAACEASLKRLGTDRIDLYQLHEIDGLTPVEETLRTLDDLVRAGKVRYVGVFNLSAWHVMKMLGVSERDRLVRPVSQQIDYTLQAREAEYELLPLSIDQGLGILIWSPLAGGLLSGKYRSGKDKPEGTRVLANWGEPPVRDEDKLCDIVDALVDVAEARDATPAQVALAWLAGRAANVGSNHRCPHRGAARRQPQGGRSGAVCGGPGETRHGERAAAALSILASSEHRVRPAVSGRSLAPSGRI